MVTGLSLMRAIRWWFFFIIMFYLCALLAVIPFPLTYEWFRPQWLLMLIIFCQVINPGSFNPIWAWIVGLFLDSLLGTGLGEHALVFAVISYITALLRPRFLMKPLWLQVGKVFLLIALGQIFILWFHALAGKNPHTLLYWMGTVTSCVAWPIFVLLLQSLCHSFSIVRFPSRSM